VPCWPFCPRNMFLFSRISTVCFLSCVFRNKLMMMMIMMMMLADHDIVMLVVVTTVLTADAIACD